ncbi:agamous-like mads-box protein agl62 [Phtheirospermum japonicum]|uniref:Agamous-like mads-box protein agl62 n=1 Tax=Phtheirospermum japonicum TaxID=374723 RepID=A0A830DAM6_9LAMI|nr:agamous-like mads-box protein agl62 [Phtheirospermum japonicum]
MAIPNNGIQIVKKKTQGRRKIEIKKIDKLSSRQVTFSKRRVGLFRKASELCILTGAEIAIIVHSHGKRVFTFGHTSVDSVVGRFLHGGAAEVGEDLPARDYNKHYSDVCKELEGEKIRNQANGYGGGGGGDGGFWCDAPVDGLELEESERYLAALDELIRNAVVRADELMMARTAAGVIGRSSGVGEGLSEGMAVLMDQNRWSGGSENNDDCTFPCGFGQGQL